MKAADLKVGDRIRLLDHPGNVVTVTANNGPDDPFVDLSNGMDINRRSSRFEMVQSDAEHSSPVDPDHYRFPGGVQVIDITRHMDFLTGNAVKYLTRAGRKTTSTRREDLQKALRYVQWAIEDAE